MTNKLYHLTVQEQYSSETSVLTYWLKHFPLIVGLNNLVKKKINKIKDKKYSVKQVLGLG